MVMELHISACAPNHDASSIDGKNQDFNVAQAARVDSDTVPMQNLQFELSMDCKDDVEMYTRTTTQRYVTAPSGTPKISRYWN